jgi:hypothetical protein
MSKILGESNFQYNSRLDFIKLIDDAEIDEKDKIKLSKIWFNIKYNNCRYPKKIYDKVCSFNKLV